MGGNGTVRHRVFLLSPANASGDRGKLLLRPDSKLGLALRLRRDGVTLGEAFAFISGLYFRGKMAYAQTFASPCEGTPGAFIITAGYGLLPPEVRVSFDELQRIASVPINVGDARYREPLERACRAVAEAAGPECDFVLLGSIATLKYLEPMFRVFGERLLFPEEFIGRGDMSRGGLLLRAAHSGQELKYIPLGNLARHGPRPPRLPGLSHKG